MTNEITIPRGLYFEDLRDARRFRSAGVTVTEDAIIRFALEWDAQPFHIDREAAAGSLFGSLVGSGLQTVMLTYRLYFQMGLLDGTAMAGLGIDRIKFLRPLIPGDTLHVMVEAVAVRPSGKPDRGIATIRLETLNQKEETILTMELSALVARRPAPEGAGGSEAVGGPLK